MENIDLRKVEDQSFYEEDRDQPIPPNDVVAYNELRSCADLYRMFATGKLEIQPDFQREVVWKNDEQSRFINSLVKQLPIPSMCFSLDYKTQRWKVIDGLQRMSTITGFLGTSMWKIAQVDDIHPLLKGKTNKDLREGSDDQRKIYSAVEDLSVPVTVIRCSYDNDSHMRYLFMIFNRLNSGGVRLNNQEIRNCIYSGLFNNLLKSFNSDNKNWAAVKSRIWGPMNRFRSVEVLLRALAFSEELDEYDGNLAGFLNKFMYHRMNTNDIELTSTLDKLTFMATHARQALSFLPVGKKSLTFVEGILVGMLANKRLIESIDEQERLEWLQKRSLAFAELPIYLESVRYALSTVRNVVFRLSESINVFSK